jgi:hypothetical protein
MILNVRVYDSDSKPLVFESGKINETAAFKMLTLIVIVLRPSRIMTRSPHLTKCNVTEAIMEELK